MLQWTAHKHRVRALGYSPDGAMLVSGGNGQSVGVWDPVSGEQRADVRHDFPSIEDLAFSPDEQILALAVGGAVIVCDHACLRNGPLAGASVENMWDSAVSSIAFSPDGRNLVSAGGQDRSSSRATLWDVLALKEGGQKRINSLNFENPGELTAAYAPDGRTIALGSGRGVILLWPYPIHREHLRRPGERFDRVVHDRQVRRSRVVEVRTGSEEPVRRIAFSPDNTTLAAAIGNVVDLWDYRHPDEKRPLLSNRRILLGHGQAVRSLAFAPDGRTIATVSRDGTLRLWDARETYELSCLDVGAGPLHCLAFAPDGMTVAVGTEQGDVVIIDVERP